MSSVLVQSNSVSNIDKLSLSNFTSLLSEFQIFCYGDTNYRVVVSANSIEISSGKIEDKAERLHEKRIKSLKRMFYLAKQSELLFEMISQPEEVRIILKNRERL